MTDAVHGYLLDHGVREPEPLAALRDATSKLEMARMQISPEQGGFMTMLVGLMGAKRAIEVGTFTGYSAACVALALPEDGELIACDVSEEWTAMGRPAWEALDVADRIDLRIAPAAETLEQLIADGRSASFDFAFIDADKTNYRVYYEHLLTLIRPGGLIAIDNVLWGGSVVDEANQEPDTKAIRALNTFLATDPRVTISMLPVGDGLTLCRKR